MSNVFVLAARLRATKLRGIYVHVDQLTTEAADALTAQAREIEALRADAERYRWLRDNRLDDWAICVWCPHEDGYYRDGRAPEIVDAAIDAAMQAGKAPDTDKCRKCGGRMVEGTYLAQTFSGTPDFPGDKHAVTVSPSGPGRLAECLKCAACGWSVTSGKAVTPHDNQSGD